MKTKAIYDWIAKKRVWIGLFVLIVIGIILRTGACFYGYPHRLHPDEHVIVDNAIDILNRHTYEPADAEWPAHLLMKLSALIFDIFSRVYYGMAAVEAFDAHTTVFYVLSRLIVMGFGVLMIPLSYFICEEIYPKSGKYTAAIVTIFPMFVVHSGYATPDIPLTFMTMLVSYLAMQYLKKDDNRYLYYICIATGIAITIKYTAGVLCLIIAAIICIKYWKNSKLSIVKYGMLSILLVIASVFFLAPNLFTDWQLTVDTFVYQSRSDHLGVSNLGFLGNFKYYLDCYIKNIGWLGILFTIVGIVIVLKRNEKKKNFAGLGVGFIFWAAISVLALHWERWGLPVYSTFIMLAGIGMCYLVREVFFKEERNSYSGLIRIGGSTLIAVFVITLMSFTAVYYVKCIVPTYEARIAALEFCQNNHITEEESIYEGYTPFFMEQPMQLELTLDSSGKLVFPDDKSGVKYIILSSSMYGRYYNESERYSQEVATYEKIKEDYELIYTTPLIYPKSSNWSVMKIVYNIKYIYDMVVEGKCYGSVIQIYKVN